MIPQRIARQYAQYCHETGFKPFSERTMLRVLEKCKASVRKSLQGLDHVAADGACAFEDLENLVRRHGELGLGKKWELQYVELLKGSKLYLKSDFKVHVCSSSEIASHCSVFALSDSTSPDLQQQCSHKHEECCEQCEILHSTLQNISSAVERASFATQDDKEEALFLVNASVLAIQSWKCHLLRSAHQDQARLDAIDALDQETVFIVNDWAMKFLPHRYRESQADWFGKRGLSVQSCSQGSSAVASIMHHVLETLKHEHPEINKAYFRQDNAGCYHSTRTILACREMAASTGVKVVRIDFSDPQGRKGAADRLAASCKRHIRAFIDEGNDVCTADELKDALLSHGGLKGVRVVSLDTIIETPDSGQTIKGPRYQVLQKSFSEGDFTSFQCKSEKQTAAFVGEGHFVPNEGWALRAAKKAYRFSEKQKSYLLAKFSIGQTTGRKLDAEVVAREMRRARGADGVRLFQSSEFLTSLQIASFFSRQSATLRQKDPADEADIRASQEEANFSAAKEVVETIQLNHPLVYDQYNLCEMALSGNLKVLKLPMLQRLCEDLGLDAPVPPVRKKAPYLALLEEIAKKCTCRK
ncbi:uncharacterized protein [Montipora capricornis]|uniref:uncharacterized protein n=1 Tax=Montipora capricornis TaxID=246305 RepID=UPI0035F10582